MICFIIIPFAFLQQPAKHDGAGDKQQVRRYDDHYDGEKKRDQRGDRILDRQRKIISASQNQRAQESQKPV